MEPPRWTSSFPARTKPTAIFCLSDQCSGRASSGRRSHRGIRVPDQLSVIGCGDDFCAHFIVPQMTTVHLPAEEMAQRGVQEIERLVRETAADRTAEAHHPGDASWSADRAGRQLRPESARGAIKVY